VTGPHRNTIRGRYRHWLRHKVGTWWDQFGMSGCVGCGRCITWCPVGIDLTREIARIRGQSPAYAGGAAQSR
jgi:ferredoxin